MLSTIYIVFFIGAYHPKRVQRQNYYDIASEVVIIFTLDLLLISSDPVIDAEAKFGIGVAIVALITLQILFSFGSIIISNLKNLKLYILRCYNRRVGQRKIQERQLDTTDYENKVINNVKAPSKRQKIVIKQEPMFDDVLGETQIQMKKKKNITVPQ